MCNGLAMASSLIWIFSKTYQRSSPVRVEDLTLSTLPTLDMAYDLILSRSGFGIIRRSRSASWIDNEHEALLQQTYHSVAKSLLFLTIFSTQWHQAATDPWVGQK